jgi:hypothetical protein
MELPCQSGQMRQLINSVSLEEAHAAPVGVEGVHIVDDDELVAVAVELHVHPEGDGVPLDPARLGVPIVG